MAATLRLEIVTPEGTTCSEDVEMVTLPGIEGEMGIYPQHVPLVTQLVPGEVSIQSAGQRRLLAVGPGFAEITATRVALLTEVALDAAGMAEDAIAAALRAAEKRLQERLDGDDAARVNAAIAKSIQQLRGRVRRPVR